MELKNLIKSPKVNLNLDKDTVEELSKELLETDVTVDECLNQALVLLLWAIQEKRKNRGIACIDFSTSHYYLFQLGLLDKIIPNTVIDSIGDSHTLN